MSEKNGRDLKQKIASWKPEKFSEPVKAFGLDLAVCRLSTRDRDLFDTCALVQEDLIFNLEEEERRPARARMNLAGRRATLVMLTLIDPCSQQKIFKYPADFEQVCNLDHEEIEKIYETSAAFNGVDTEAIERAKKNSSEIHTSDSGLGSASPSATDQLATPSAG